MPQNMFLAYNYIIMHKFYPGPMLCYVRSYLHSTYTYTYSIRTDNMTGNLQMNNSSIANDLHKLIEAVCEGQG